MKKPEIFCDFCSCWFCKWGWQDSPEEKRAKTSDGRHICSTCFAYDICTSGPNRNKYGPCDDAGCVHRPALVSDWAPWTPDKIQSNQELAGDLDE